MLVVVLAAAAEWVEGWRLLRLLYVAM